MGVDINRSQKIQFASDNYSGMCPEAAEALIAANSGHARAYGDDPWTGKAAYAVREFFDTDCDVFFVSNGTAANSLALATLCRPYHSVICHEVAHIETDECGGPEFFTGGTKILTIPGRMGRIDLDAAEKMVTRRSDIHYPKPRALSITQPTELGTLYTPEQLNEIGDFARRYDLRIHMDGARFANALAALNVHPSEISWKAGVDVLCLGGTKNGMAFGEAVIFFNRECAREFGYRCKQGGQLASKMRFLAAPWSSMLSGGSMLKNAERANSAAIMLEKRLRYLPVLEIVYPREVNSVFIAMPEEVAAAMKERGWHFYDFIGTGHSRFMCSWETTEKDIKDLVDDFREEIKRYQACRGSGE
ncbi:MAG TPA: low specificity L-threonine aldolase [Spirochaetota bacterium]|nr:low specificity L-threonine aldolase [Spirochaetota bacterium]HPJ39369.1 low specificity L-threonine aldolase [Spirochaetota bacterium]HPQ52243.1 low specificity L-threonine aldolase [Spirochaetota bacterium]